MLLGLVVAVPSATSAQLVSAVRNGKIAFAGPGLADADPRVTVVNPDGSGLRYLSRFGSACRGPTCGGSEPAWSPDGKQIAYVKNASDGYIYIIRSDGKRRRRLVPGDDPTWSPGGRTLAYSLDGISVVDVDGRHDRVIRTPPELIDYDTAWSPDGSRIAFTEGLGLGGGARCAHSHQARLFVMKSNGTNVTRLTTSGDNFAPTWSPDGKKIAFLTVDPRKDNPYVVMTMNANGRDQRIIARITLTPCVSAGLAWSPDGARLAFVAQRGSASPSSWIFTMRLDGTDVRAVTRGDSRLSWQALRR